MPTIPRTCCGGKIRSARFPAPILEDGRALCDSSVIVEYLDALAGGGRIIPDGGGRFAALTRQSLADGVKDAAILQLYKQRFRAPEFSFEQMGSNIGRFEG